MLGDSAGSTKQKGLTDRDGDVLKVRAFRAHRAYQAGMYLDTWEAYYVVHESAASPSGDDEVCHMRPHLQGVVRANSNDADRIALGAFFALR